MDQQSVIGPDLGRSLNPGFLLKPGEQRFNRLSDPTDGRREPLTEGVQVGLSFSLFHRGPQGRSLLRLAKLPEQLIDIGFVQVGVCLEFAKKTTIRRKDGSSRYRSFSRIILLFSSLTENQALAILKIHSQNSFSKQ